MFKCLHLCIQTYPKIPSCSYILVWAKYRFTFLPSNYRRVNNFLSEFMWKNKEIPTCRAMSAGAAASTARPSFFFPFSRTRTHAHTEEATSSPLSPLGLLLVPPNTLTRVGLSISQSSLSSPLPSLHQVLPPADPNRNSVLRPQTTNPVNIYALPHSLPPEFLAPFSLAQIIMPGKIIFFPFSFEPERPKLSRSSPQISGAVASVWYGRGLK